MNYHSKVPAQPLRRLSEANSTFNGTKNETESYSLIQDDIDRALGVSRFIRELIEEKLKFHQEINSLKREIDRLESQP